MNKVVIITGGSSGIGKACAFAFGRSGCRIVITGRDAVRLQATAQELNKANIECLAVAGDISNEADVKSMIEKTVQAFHGIDILINNAGISMRALFEELELDVIKRVMDINFYGAVYATKYALPYIIERKGSIIGISSIAGYRGLPGRTGYSASKFALQGFLEALRTELLPKGVHVLVACPGFTASNIRNTALAADGNIQGESPREESKMMTSEAVANEILRATIHRKRDLVLTFQGKFTIFLNRWLPGLADKLVYNHMKKEKDSPFK